MGKKNPVVMSLQVAHFLQKIEKSSLFSHSEDVTYIIMIDNGNIQSRQIFQYF